MLCGGLELGPLETPSENEKMYEQRAASRPHGRDVGPLEHAMQLKLLGKSKYIPQNKNLASNAERRA